MSFPTKPAYVHHGEWEDESRKHPALKWMEHVTRGIFDKHLWSTPYDEMYTDDCVFLKPDGSEIKGGEKTFATLAEIYGPLTAQYTEPFYQIVTETEDGWDMIGQAWIYGNLPGEPASGEEKVKDLSGRTWEIKISGGFRFQYVKDTGAIHDGIQMKTIQIMSDTAPVLKAMVGRGLVKASDLGF